MAEGVALPLVHDAWITALVFTVLNAALLTRAHPLREPAARRGGSAIRRPTSPGPARERPVIDLLVAGGGPVGLAVAIRGRLAGLDVTVVEPRSTPVDKACGEGLMPSAVRGLRDLGVEVDGHPFAGIGYVAGHRRVEARFADGPGLGVRRTTLHAALAARADDVGRRRGWRAGSSR